MTNFENWDDVKENDLGGHVHLVVEKVPYEKDIEKAKEYIRNFCKHFGYKAFKLHSQSKKTWEFFIFDKQN